MRDGKVTMTADGARFAPWHKADRNFFLLMMAIIWLGILMGFVPDFIRHLKTDKLAYPLAVHFHAAAMVGWLLLLTTQILFIRAGRPDIHRKLGVAGAVLATAIVVLGPITAVTVDNLRFGTPQGDAPFLAIQIADIVNFGVLVGAAIFLRNTPSAHKRLMLLATIFIADAGFARWWSDGLEKLLGDGFWQDWVQDYVADLILIVAFGVYDVVTRRRLHPAFVIGATWGLAVQLVAVWLYVSPWWKPIATKLIGH